MKFLAMVVAAVVTLSVTPAMAYVGPGAGLSLLGAFWGLLVAILAAISFVILYPIRRLVRVRKRPAEALEPADVRSDGQATDR
jgi:membrane protein implicated in regulation of membrane protease activity